MENWKIATIAVLLLSLLGFGIWQQNADTKAANTPPTPVAAAKPSPYIGKTLPSWDKELTTWRGAAVPFASLNGKPSFVEIFRIECPHCQDAAPFMVALQDRYAPRGLKIVAIQSPGDYKNSSNPETQWPAVQAWLKQYKINYPVAFDKDSKYFQGTTKKQVLNNDDSALLYPTMLLLDKNGKITFAETGHDVSKAITLAVELEKRFPGSADVQKNADDLVKWLKTHLQELQVDGAMEKSLRDDIAQRLQGKQ